jgi:hypothetical protein
MIWLLYFALIASIATAAKYRARWLHYKEYGRQLAMAERTRLVNKLAGGEQ